MKYNHLILEACVETLEEAIKAEQNGAHRIELCSRLDLDGLTPDVDLTRQVLRNVSIPVKVMIRPREWDFMYSDEEFEQMKKEIEVFKKMRVHGVVFGILDLKNRLELDRIRELASLASPLEVTVHKAIDLCEDPVAEAVVLSKLSGVDCVLTSGGATTAIEGQEVIRRMIAKAAPLRIIAAGRITRSNLAEAHRLIGASEYHGRRIVVELQ
jgi:copper homeostasis protein